jgi:hypothetical protein
MKIIIIRITAYAIFSLMLDCGLAFAEGDVNAKKLDKQNQLDSYPFAAINVLLTGKIISDEMHPYVMFSDYLKKNKITPHMAGQSLGCGVEFRYIEMNDPKATFTVVSCSTGVQIIAYSSNGVKMLVEWLNAKVRESGNVLSIPYGVHVAERN